MVLIIGGHVAMLRCCAVCLANKCYYGFRSKVDVCPFVILWTGMQLLSRPDNSHDNDAADRDCQVFKY